MKRNSPRRNWRLAAAVIRTVVIPHAACAEIGHAIGRCFGSYEAFVREFMCASADCHGSGWIWLVYQQAEVKIVLTANSDSPLLTGQVTLLGVDLWEHAFYLDHQNRRAEYVRTFLEDLVNWDFANQNLEAARRRS